MAMPAAAMTVVDWLRDADPAWVVLVFAIGLLMAIPVLRRLVPASRRHRGGAALLFAGLALTLALGAIASGGMGGASAAGIVQLVALLALAIGVVAATGLVVFDLVLARLGANVPSILRDFVQVAVAGGVVMGFLRLAGLDVFSLVTTSAVLTAVIGLALQSTIANVFGGLGLQLDRTLGHGEWIEVGNHVGRILEIGWRSTRIVTKDGDTVFVPNGELVAGKVLNFSRPTGAHRMTVRIGFHYRHPPNEVRRVLLAAVHDTPGVLETPAPECGPTDFGDSAVVYGVRYWIADFGQDATIDEEVRTRLWYAARRAGLEIPFPIRTVISEVSAPAARVGAEAEEQAERLSLLARAEPFAALEETARERLARAMGRGDFGAGQTIIRAGEADDAVYLIASGEVAVCQAADGTTQELIAMRAGDLLSVGSLATSDGPPTSCTARSEVTVYRIDRAAVAGTSPYVAGRLSALLAAHEVALRAARATLGPVRGPRGVVETAARLVPRVRGLFGQA
jgi:small-conductance mechanosensitive channel/CRP-like cAMP-binding protein